MAMTSTNLTRSETLGPDLNELCRYIRSEILGLSGLIEEELDGHRIELREDYFVWCEEIYKGPDLADSFIGFQKMLEHWPVPWDVPDSELNGLDLSQFYLVWAYADIMSSLEIIDCIRTGNSLPIRDALDDAACYAVLATKSLMFAKALKRA